MKTHSKTSGLPAISKASATQEAECSKTITRADLAEALTKTLSITRHEAAKSVEMVLDEICDCIAVSREDVKLHSFGNFHIRAKNKRRGRNPKTGESATITARLVVIFKPSRVMRQRVSGSFERVNMAPSEFKRRSVKKAF